MSYAFENMRLRDKNAAMLRELDKMRAARDEALEELAKMRAAQAATSARAERLGQMVDLATEAMKCVNDTARKVIAERDAALARAADSDARLVRAIDAAKAAALAALAAPGPAAAAEGSPELSDEERGRNTCGDADCPLCEYYR
jgi:hypothetical protein